MKLLTVGRARSTCFDDIAVINLAALDALNNLISFENFALSKLDTNQLFAPLLTIDKLEGAITSVARVARSAVGLAIRNIDLIDLIVAWDGCGEANCCIQDAEQDREAGHDVSSEVL